MMSDRNFLSVSLGVAGLGVGAAFAVAVAVTTPARADRIAVAAVPALEIAAAEPAREGSVR